MTAVTVTTQLSTFSTIRTILLSNTTLAAKFTSNDIYQYEPNLKSPDIRLPYIAIDLPSTTTDLYVMSLNDSLKTFEISMRLVVEYQARDNFINYANAILAVIEGTESSFNGIGLFNIKCEFQDASTEILKEQQVIAGNFSITGDGTVGR